MIYGIDNDISLQKTCRLVLLYKDSNLINSIIQPFMNLGNKTTTIHVDKDSDVDDLKAYIKYKPFFDDKWFIKVSYSQLSKKSKEQVIDYFKRVNHNYRMIITVSNYKDIKYLSKDKLLQESKEVVLFNYRSISYKYIQSRVVKNINHHITSSALKKFISYVWEDRDNIDNYIDMLNACKCDINDELVSSQIPDKRTFDFCNYLTFVLNKEKPKSSLTACNDLLTKYGFKIFKVQLFQHINILIMIKSLLYKGLVSFSIYEDCRKLKLRGELPSILENKSKKILEAYVKLIVGIPMSDLLCIKMIYYNLNNVFEVIGMTSMLLNRDKWDTEDKEFIIQLLRGEQNVWSQ